MGSIVLGVGASHSTLMNTHWDQVVHTDRAEAFRDSLAAVRQRLEDARPDVAVIIGSNHFRGFFLDMIPAFTMGVGEVVAAGEAGTPKGPQKADPVLAQRIATHLVESVSRWRSRRGCRSTTVSRTRSSTCWTASTCPSYRS
jgi:2,3-dihydroxyphenylpropionate 1,2-dioxygenase